MIDEIEGKYQILTDYRLGPQILDIIKEAKEYCFIVTPFFNDKYWGHLTNSLKEASDDKRRMLFIFSKPVDNIENDDLKQKRDKDNENIDKIKKKLNAEYNFDLYFVERLHAKIYLNEKEVLITSMNLQQSANGSNHEIGCLFKDPSTSLYVVNEIIFKQILKEDKKDYVKGMWSQWLTNGYFEQFLNHNNGYCIKCKNPTPYNENNPFCDKCNNDSKSTHTNYCHKCGKNYQNISKEHPLCYPCFSNIHGKKPMD